MKIDPSGHPVPVACHDSTAISINGTRVLVEENISVAAAILATGIADFRRSVTGRLRGPLCGIGICFECRVSIDGQPHSRSCQVMCRDGMAIVTHD